jgi:hypothetical protein
MSCFAFKSNATVGASQSYGKRLFYGDKGKDYLADFSSRGPTADGTFSTMKSNFTLNPLHVISTLDENNSFINSQKGFLCLLPINLSDHLFLFLQKKVE